MGEWRERRQRERLSKAQTNARIAAAGPQMQAVIHTNRLLAETNYLLRVLIQAQHPEIQLPPPVPGP